MKAVHWYIDFVSRKGTQYKLCIYDNYAGVVPPTWPIQLDGAPAPLETGESNDGSIFEPIRTSTGTLRICTKLPSGEMLDVRSILPISDISKPVQLLKINNNQQEVVWNGFLSCEALDQPYNSVPEIIEIPVQSALQAADSVEVEQSETFAFSTILTHIVYAIRDFVLKTDMLFGDVYISSRFYDVLRTKKIFNNSYFKSEENIGGDSVYIDVHSISVKNILAQIAAFFGMTIREHGLDIFLTDEKTTEYKKISYTGLVSWLITQRGEPTVYTVPSSMIDIDSFEWCGTNHVLSVEQGTKRVAISANLADCECKMSILDTPKDNLVVNPSSRWAAHSKIYANTNNNYYSQVEHQTVKVKMYFPYDGTTLGTPYLDFVSASSTPKYDETIFWQDNEMRTYYEELVVRQTKASNTGIEMSLCSYMALWRDSDNKLQQGLMICGFPDALIWSVSPVQGRAFNKFTRSNAYLFKNTTALNFMANSGYFKLNASILTWFSILGKSEVPYTPEKTKLNIAISVGNKWATYNAATNSTGWTSSFNTFNISFIYDSESGEYKMQSNWKEGDDERLNNALSWKILDLMVGKVTIYIFPYVYGIHGGDYYSMSNSLFDVMLKTLDIEYLPLISDIKNDRSENRYFKNTGRNFKNDEVSVSVGLASYANNNKYATLIWDNETTPCKLVTLDNTDIRPEVDVLNRMCDYYRDSRSKLELEALHSDSVVIPITKVQGINDEKIYIPIAENRNWKEDKSTITLLETPDGDE